MSANIDVVLLTIICFLRLGQTEDTPAETTTTTTTTTTSTTTTTTTTTTPFPGYEARCYCPGDPLYETRGELFPKLVELRHQADIGGSDPAKLEVYRVPVNREPGVPSLDTLRTLLPTTDDQALKKLDLQSLLDTLGISTKEKVIKTCYLGPPIVEPENTTGNDTETPAERRKRAAPTVTGAPARLEGVNMLIPRTIMTGVEPQQAAVKHVRNAVICSCPEPATRLRKNIIVKQFVWIPSLADPTDLDFQAQKRNWEKSLNEKLNIVLGSKNLSIGGLTILSMRQDPVIETEIILDTETLFGSEANGTDIADHLDRVSFGGQFSSNLTTDSVCNISALPTEFPVGNGSFLTLMKEKSQNINTDPNGDKLVPSGLFAYFRCSDETKYLNMTTLDLDMDGEIGIQCQGGEWDIESLPTDENSTCITELSCDPNDYTSKIATSKFKMPTEKYVRPGEFLFLTCDDPQNFLDHSLDPLPVIFPLFCNASSGTKGELEPYKKSSVWPVCKSPEYCPLTNAMVPPDLVPYNDSTGEFNFTAQSWLVRDESLTQVREYSFVEFTCNNTDHVAGNFSTFRVQCPPSGNFPTVYEYPVKEADGNYSDRFVSPVLDNTRKIVNENLTYWPLCRPSVKCWGEVPRAPYYSNLVTAMKAPIKEYDKVVYTCYDESLRLPDKAKSFDIECGSDGEYKIAKDALWPVCRTTEEHSKPCHCLGDRNITDPEVCMNLEDGQCKAKVLLDKLCRNNTLIRTKVTTDYKTNIPLKDRCGVYDLEVAMNPCTSIEEHAENICYCNYREDRGVKDVFQVEFNIVSKLYVPDMSYTRSEFGKMKGVIEKSFDELILKNLNASVLRESQFVKTVIMQVKTGPKVKCRDYPKPAEENGYISITQSIDDVRIGESYYFQCERGFWRPEDNSTEPFGFPCTEGNFTETFVGEYNLSSIEQKCVPDEFYVPGCKVQDRFPPDGDAASTGMFIDPTNEDNILVNNSLRYLCPENPNNLGTRLVADNSADFYVLCEKDAVFETVAKSDWPACREPVLCPAADGPPLPQSVKTSGLRDSYSDIYEFQNLTFMCTEESKEPAGNMTVLRQFSADPSAPKLRVFEVECGKGGVWLAPNETDEWPLCMYKDEYSCDPLEEITKSNSYLSSAMKPESTSFVYKGDQAAFVCNQTGYTTDQGDRIFVECDESGDFIQPSSWPVCRPPSCQMLDRPNITGELSVNHTDDTAVNNFLEYKCPGGNITEEGRSILLQCLGNHQYETRDSWPECRPPGICYGDVNPPEISDEALASGLRCNWTDTEEFLSQDCYCLDSSKVLEDGAEMPYCRRNAIWAAPFTWPLCVDPPRCEATAAPPVPASVAASGLTGQYSDLLEDQVTMFQCNETIREIIGGDSNATETISVKDPDTNLTRVFKVFKVTCGEGGIWTQPNDEDWPSCEYLDSAECSVSQDLNNSLPAGFKLKDSAVSSVLNNQSLDFVCNETGHAAVLSSGSRVTEFSVQCGSEGKFDSSQWPLRCEEFSNCVAASFPQPSLNQTGGLSLVAGQTSVNVSDFLLLECPGGQITEEGLTVKLQCSSPDTFQTKVWPACRDLATCLDSSGPEPPANHGLVCSYTNTTELQEFTGCVCNDSSLTPDGGSGQPLCALGGSWTAPDTWHNCSASEGRRKREIQMEDLNLIDLDIIGQEEEDNFYVRSKRASRFQNYIKVMMEVQFAQKLPPDRQSIVDSFVDMIKSVQGKFETVEEATWDYKIANNISDENMKVYKEKTFDIEMPPEGETKCADCIKFILPNTCSNDLLSLMKTGYSHSKPEQWTERLGKRKDTNEVFVGSSVDLYCTDYIMKPKRDIWDTDRLDGTLTIICMPNLQFNIPYDTSSWGSCLAKCPAPNTITTTQALTVDYEYMEGKTGELWENEELVYKCKNESLVINENPDLVKIKFKCRSTGQYGTPETLKDWPVCTKKPVRPEIKKAIMLMTSKFDTNIDYRNALYGGGVQDDSNNETFLSVMSITVPSFVIMLVLVIFLCCCTRPDSIICKICEPTVKEKPGGGSAQRRSARSARTASNSASNSASPSALPPQPLDEEAAIGDQEDLSSLQTEEEEIVEDSLEEEQPAETPEETEATPEEPSEETVQEEENVEAEEDMEDDDME